MQSDIPRDHSQDIPSLNSGPDLPNEPLNASLVWTASVNFHRNIFAMDSIQLIPFE